MTANVRRIETVQPEIPRDRWGRPLVVPQSGGQRVPYTRCTTFVKTVDDTYTLTRWQLRMAAIGLNERPDLRLAVAAHKDDKDKLNKILEEAQEAAQAYAAATTGTALHAFTEQLDRGADPSVPEEYQADLRAYADATSELEAVHIEQFTVQDHLKVAGTPDRVVKYHGSRYIADLKTGSIEYGYLSIAAQLAMYARSRPYDVATDTRTEGHGADLRRGIIVHLPAGEGSCQLYWVDLEMGWELVKLARDIRAHRQATFPQLVKELRPGPLALGIEDQIKSAATAEEVRAVWRRHRDEWNNHLTEVSQAHIAALAELSTPTPTT